MDSLRYNDPYGTIRLAGEGTISIHASGEKILCLGGGWSAGEGIQVLSGTLDLVCNGVSVTCVGSCAGAARIDIRNAQISVHGDGNEVLLIGSRSGAAIIRMDESEIRMSAACELLAGLGTMNGSADAVVSGCRIGCETHCDRGAAFGSFDRKAMIVFRDSVVRQHSEGYRVTGFGSLNGSCVVRVESGEVDADVLAVERLLLGNDRSRFVVTGGNIHLAQESDHPPVSPAGIPFILQARRKITMKKPSAIRRKRGYIKLTGIQTVTWAYGFRNQNEIRRNRWNGSPRPAISAGC